MMRPTEYCTSLCSGALRLFTSGSTGCLLCWMCSSVCCTRYPTAPCWDGSRAWICCRISNTWDREREKSNKHSGYTFLPWEYLHRHDDKIHLLALIIQFVFSGLTAIFTRFSMQMQHIHSLRSPLLLGVKVFYVTKSLKPIERPHDQYSPSLFILFT